MESIPAEGLPKISECFPVSLVVEPGKVYSWCSCGLTAQSPFCDSNHKRIEGLPFKSVKIVFDKVEEVLFCQCKQTKTPPFCDRTHDSVKSLQP